MAARQAPEQRRHRHQQAADDAAQQARLEPDDSSRDRMTTTAATTPKTNCEAMNQGQSTPLRSTGLTTRHQDKAHARPENGISRPPQASGLGIGGKRRQQHAVDQAENHRHDGVNDDSQQQERRGEIARARRTVIRSTPGSTMPASRLTGYQMPWPLKSP